MVLIYSKYIDGGLIPMALALEEMGFDRCNSDNQGNPQNVSLFGERRSVPLDPLTMTPTKPGQLQVARYLMITGNKYLSNDNKLDLVMLNNPANRKGELVKVVLISAAGAEGLDFSGLRQVHVIDPWYNMNSIEQIIGRGVRNKSHCRLPITERNVEIYMHSTDLGKVNNGVEVKSDPSTEEAVDLYMYRLAERKALYQGAVTRVMKEASVDCLLNIQQMKYTEGNMNQTVRIRLSTDKKEIEYKVGDKPFSSICDYMETCEYQCSAPEKISQMFPTSTALIDNLKVSTGSYGYQFLQANHPRISKRIREIFRNQLYYTFDQIKKEINILKQFPIEQIYYTLTLFLQNKNEWIVNSKGQRGYLVYKHQTDTPALYVFQPININDKNASLFDRLAPVPGKHDKFNILVKPIANDNPSIVVPSISVRSKQLNEPVIPSVTEVSMELSPVKLVADLQRFISNIFATGAYVRPDKNSTDWYNYAKLGVTILMGRHKLSAEHCARIIVHHHMETLHLMQKVALLTDLFPTELLIKQYIVDQPGQTEKNTYDKAKEDHVKKLICEYFSEKIILRNPNRYKDTTTTPTATGPIAGIILADILYSTSETGTTATDVGSGKNHAFIFSGTESGGSWTEIPGEPDTWNSWMQTYNKKLNITQSLVDNMNATKDAGKLQAEYNVGYMRPFRQICVFKIKNLLNSRKNAGAVADQAGKSLILDKVNMILKQMGEKEYDKDLTYNNITIEKYSLCVIYEGLLRYYTQISGGKNIFFLTREQVVASVFDTFLVGEQFVNDKGKYVVK
jgi:hypothetical protein